MSLLKGSVTITRLQAIGPVPSAEAAIGELKEEPFRPFEDGSEEERAGICDFTNHLKGSPSDAESYTVMDGKINFGVRIDSRKVPASELDAHVDYRLERLAKEKDLAFIGKDARISIQDEVKAELLKKQLPVAKVTQVSWGYRKGVMNIGGSGSKPLGVIRSVFFRRFGIELRQLTPVNLASMLIPTMTEADLLHGSGRDVVEPLMGRLFLAWLWRQASEAGGAGPGDDSTCLLIGDAVKLVGDEGKVQEVSLRKGEPTESRAGLEAMAEGMLPSSMKVRILDADAEWTLTLGDSLQVASMKLPKIKGGKMTDILATRTYLIEEAVEALDRRFKAWLETEWNKGLETLQDEVQNWAKGLVPEAA